MRLGRWDRPYARWILFIKQCTTEYYLNHEIQTFSSPTEQWFGYLREACQDDFSQQTPLQFGQINRAIQPLIQERTGRVREDWNV